MHEAVEAGTQIVALNAFPTARQRRRILIGEVAGACEER